MIAFIDAPSPNFDARRAPPDMLVLHYTGMETGEAALARGDRAEAEAMWSPLIAVLAPSDTRRGELQTRLAEAAR